MLQTIFFTLLVFLISSVGIAAADQQQDCSEYIARLHAAAEKGEAAAQHKLGIAYYGGTCVSIDKTEAVKWFRKSGAQGNADAAHILGALYHEGKIVKRDDAEAVKWYRLAVESAIPDAPYSLGNAYYFGAGVEKNDIEAVKWWRKAADLGSGDSQYNLGFAYYKGIGVSQDLIKAYMWASLAVTQNPKAATELKEAIEKKLSSDQISDGNRQADEWRALHPSFKAKLPTKRL